MVQGLDPNENKTSAKARETRKGSVESPQKEPRTSSRARKAVVKDGRVMINSIAERKLEEHEPAEQEKTIFHPILVESNWCPDEDEVKRFQELTGKVRTDVDEKSKTKSLIRTVKETKKAEEQAEQVEGAVSKPKKTEEPKKRFSQVKTWLKRRSKCRLEDSNILFVSVQKKLKDPQQDCGDTNFWSRHVYDQLHGGQAEISRHISRITIRSHKCQGD